MFVNCKHCNALVATDPVTDLPPERCPRCAGVLRLPQASPDTAATGNDTPAAALQDVPTTTIAAGVIEAPAQPPAPPDPASPVPDTAAAEPASVLDEGKDTDASAENAEAPTEAAAIANPAGDDGATATTQAPADAAIAVADAPAITTPASTDPVATAIETATTAASGPGFLSRTAPAASAPAGARRWRLPAAVASLALLLGLQVLLADRDRLAADAQWRPLVASVCGLFGCSLPAWHEPAAFALLAREVRPHPDAPGALRVSATFRNDARWTQAWPRLLLTLSDVDGRPVAARAFDADEYLASAPTASGLDPGQTADIALDIREPSAATVSYAFDFR
ncbi:DUF3426 domain-containing protein [Luteimonas marina]|uniref:DUF3426 domain-containing protein n=1 Tax=Luteimonas marina TaxID=488485 RepID=A0A5C5TZF0_9GAMM|nr:DUF3426 domain-containing protein [Luteimonas marina]TWT19136.1 DUF3426 domain-containing protein [Luteimonas marina]